MASSAFKPGFNCQPSDTDHLWMHTFSKMNNRKQNKNKQQWHIGPHLLPDQFCPFSTCVWSVLKMTWWRFGQQHDILLGWGHCSFHQVFIRTNRKLWFSSGAVSHCAEFRSDYVCLWTFSWGYKDLHFEWSSSAACFFFAFRKFEVKIQVWTFHETFFLFQVVLFCKQWVKFQTVLTKNWRNLLELLFLVDAGK